MNDLTDPALDPDAHLDASLDAIAYKAERAASRRLARAQGLSEAQALRRTLALSAGQAGLAALVAQRLAQRETESVRAAARAALRATAKARREARHDGGHDGGDASGAIAAGDARPPAWRAWFDGSARPNPGRCAIGVLLRGPDGAAIELARAAGHGDSSDAEYRALIALLETALAHGVDDLAIHGDSQVVIGDVTGPDAHAAPVLRAYRDSARALLARFARVYLRWVPRHKNALADALSQRVLPATDTDANPESESEPDAHPAPSSAA
ncbi:ribonuclease HI family protein [Massilia sp. 9096]|uniref:ribonuclease HI family protein n=1 Tax=Massilia sp. 9096 TaxID=1500894 RepID=UPI0009DD31D2|nr:ribonuclease HI family protein [Massilia sp. 9096]